MELTRWQRLRTRAYLFGVGMRRRMTLGVRVAMLRDQSIFLIRHTYLPGWQMPGGGVEPGETAENSAAREMLEETGFSPVAPMPLFGLYLNVNSTTNRDHIALYVCREMEQSFPFAPNLEIAEAGWFDFAALPGQTTPATRRRLDELVGDAPQSSNW